MLYAIVAVIALIIDQGVKYWTTVNIVVDTGEAKLIPGFIHLANIHNTGAAFSFLEGARWFFVALCIVFCLVVIYVLVKDIISQPLARWMAVLVMAGAIGNCIDRIVCGYVVDMFEFEFLIFGKPFPVFNVADIYITVGVIIFCICIILEKPAAKKTNIPFSEGQAAAEEKPVRTRVPRRQRTPIPDFPKHEPVEEPTVDPNDPFAEWEKARAEAPQPARKYSKDAVDFVKILSEAPVATLEPEPAPAEPELSRSFEPAPAAQEAPRPAAAKPERKGFDFAPPAATVKSFDAPAAPQPAPAAPVGFETPAAFDTPVSFEAPAVAAPAAAEPIVFQVPTFSENFFSAPEDSKASPAAKAPEKAPMTFEAPPMSFEAPPVTYPAPVARDQNEGDYDLDAILAEFRDL